MNYNDSFVAPDWRNNSSPDLEAENLNKINTFIKELDARTKDLKSKQMSFTAEEIHNLRNLATALGEAAVYATQATSSAKLAKAYADSIHPGAAGGVATLDANGKVPVGQIPGEFDDVLEYPTRADFPLIGQSKTLYVDTSTDKVYRWTGSTYVMVGGGEIPTKLSELENDMDFVDLETMTQADDDLETEIQELDRHIETVRDAIPTLLSELQEDAAHRTVSDQEIANWNTKAEMTDIPTHLDQLETDAENRTVTDNEKAAWNRKGSYSKPSGGIPKSDLASAVQTSINKADNSVQKELKEFRVGPDSGLDEDENPNRILFGDGNYVWIGESEDDYLDLHASNDVRVNGSTVATASNISSMLGKMAGQCTPSKPSLQFTIQAYSSGFIIYNSGANIGLWLYAANSSAVNVTAVKTVSGVNITASGFKLTCADANSGGAYGFFRLSRI